MKGTLVVGLDFGTDSVRVLVADAANGKELATDVACFPRWAKGQYCEGARNQFRQHPQDHIDAMAQAVRTALGRLPRATAADVAGIGVDTTGSTPCAVDKDGTPLSLLDGFRDNPNAMWVFTPTFTLYYV